MQIQEKARSMPLIAKAEVLVLGGCTAGIAAAASAAAAGCSTMLVERYGFGGSAFQTTGFRARRETTARSLVFRGKFLPDRAQAKQRQARRLA